MVCVESRSGGEQEGASRSREQEERMLKHVLGTVVCRARLRWKEQPMATVDCNFFFSPIQNAHMMIPSWKLSRMPLLMGVP